MKKLIFLLSFVPVLGYGQTYEVIDRNAGSPTYGQRSRYEVRDNSQLGSFDYSTNVEEYDHNAAVDEAIERGYNQGNSFNNNRSNRNTSNNTNAEVLDLGEVYTVYSRLKEFKENKEYASGVLFLKDLLNSYKMEVQHQNEFKSIISSWAITSKNYEDFCKYSMYLTKELRNDYSKELKDYCNGTLVNQKNVNKKEFISKRNELVKIWNKAIEYVNGDMPMMARTELDNVSRLLNKMPDNSLSMKFKLGTNESLAQAYFSIGDYQESIFWLNIVNLKSGKNIYPWVSYAYYAMYKKDTLQTQYLKDCCNNLKKGLEMGYQNIGLLDNKDIESATIEIEKYLEGHKDFYKRMCENNLNLLSRQDAINKLKEAKELLDIEMMTRKEFDKLKEELGPIIKGS